MNCLLYNLEKTLEKAYILRGDDAHALACRTFAERRSSVINTYCWDKEAYSYYDYDFAKGKPTPHITLACVFPLFFNIADKLQADFVAAMLTINFLKTGGLTTTLENTGQQWDAPNGWAPLQWMAYKGLKNYGHDNLANQIKENWLNANQRIYEKTGKMTEKYDVYNQDLEAGGGEYPLQDGFGWTNGVCLALMADN